MKKLLSTLFLLFSSPAVAGVSCSVPFNLTNGTIADASQVMANYNAILACLSTSTAASGANSDITSLLGLTTPLAPGLGGTSTFVGGTSTVAANAQVVATLTPNSFTLATGNTVIFLAGFTNTGAMTLNVNSTGAKNVFRQTPSGAQAMTGGEIVAGSVVQVVYDGTQYELVAPQSQFGGFGPQTNLASATPDLGTIPSHNVNITGTTTITAFGSTASTTYPFYRVTFAGALTLTYNATSLILPGTANITTAANDTALLMYLGGGNWQVIQYSQANGQPVVGKNNVDFQVFTTPGANTWTRVAGVTTVQFTGCAGGGGAGGGGRTASTTAGGGGGGGGGACHSVTLKATDAGASQTVTVGTAGTGGAGSTTNGVGGTNGVAGGTTSFGSLISLPGGGLGSGGPATSSGGAAGTGGGNVGLVIVGANGATGGAGTGSGSPASAGNAVYNGAPGGGGGGGLNGVSTNAGGAGGVSVGCPVGPAGGAAGSNPGLGPTAPDFNYHIGCGGAGGGSASAGVGGAGSAGTNGGGGGGGGAGDAVNGGAGGGGGAGFALVISW